MVKFPDAVDCGFPHFMDLEFATSEKTNAVRNSLLEVNNNYSTNEEINSSHVKILNDSILATFMLENTDNKTDNQCNTHNGRYYF